MDSKTPLSKVHGVNKMKNRKYHTVRTVPKSNIKIVEIDKFVTPNNTNTWPFTYLSLYRHMKKMEKPRYRQNPSWQEKLRIENQVRRSRQKWCRDSNWKIIEGNVHDLANNQYLHDMSRNEKKHQSITKPQAWTRGEAKYMRTIASNPSEIGQVQSKNGSFEIAT